MFCILYKSDKLLWQEGLRKHLEKLFFNLSINKILKFKWCFKTTAGDIPKNLLIWRQNNSFSLKVALFTSLINALTGYYLTIFSCCSVCFLHSYGNTDLLMWRILLTMALFPHSSVDIRWCKVLLVFYCINVYTSDTPTLCLMHLYNIWID